jgi:hypothetical protein
MMRTYVLASVTRLKRPLSGLVLFVVWIAGAATSTRAASGLSAHNVHDTREIVGEHVQPSRWLPSENESGKSNPSPTSSLKGASRTGML